MFATGKNRILDKYISREFELEATNTDALTINWKELMVISCHQPFSVLLRVLVKIYGDWPRGILIVPNWPTQPWFLLLKQERGYSMGIKTSDGRHANTNRRLMEVVPTTSRRWH